MVIGNLKIENPIVLAPMAGVTDCAFRQLCKEFGAGLLVSEMISAKGLYYNDKKTAELAFFEEWERPFGLQLFGSEPEIMAIAAKKLLDFKPDFLDINMGCPTPKIVQNGDGSALMKNLPLAGEVIRAVVNAVSIPVTVKFRAGWDKKSLNAPELAKICEASGASAITIHGRTREQFYAPPVDLEMIARVKTAVKIPVIGNGDINSYSDAKKMLAETGVDGIMIGRGALGNPTIFEEIIKDENFIPPTPNEKLTLALRHLALIVKYKGEYIGVREARKHISWYLKGLKNSHHAKTKVNMANTYDEMKAIIEELIF
jgi:tRNA-dihydrouridine synthase B